jgi:hypothetical protein
MNYFLHRIYLYLRPDQLSVSQFRLPVRRGGGLNKFGDLIVQFSNEPSPKQHL